MYLIKRPSFLFGFSRKWCVSELLKAAMKVFVRNILFYFLSFLFWQKNRSQFFGIHKREKKLKILLKKIVVGPKMKFAIFCAAKNVGQFAKLTASNCSFFFFIFFFFTRKLPFPNASFTSWHKGGSPGLLVMGGDSCSKGRQFKSLRRILDGRSSHTHTPICCKICSVCLKRPK